MNKKLHFAPNLVPLVLSGEKTSTWRLWDDKNLSEGDVVDFLESKSEKHFATARLVKVSEKPLGKLSKEDKSGHENFDSDEQMFKIYRSYYNKPVDENTVVKIIKFELL